MNLRNAFKPIAAILLSAGLITFGVAPADAAAPHKTPTHTTFDTGWGLAR